MFEGNTLGLVVIFFQESFYPVKYRFIGLVPVSMSQGPFLDFNASLYSLFCLVQLFRRLDVIHGARFNCFFVNLTFCSGAIWLIVLCMVLCHSSKQSSIFLLDNFAFQSWLFNAKLIFSYASSFNLRVTMVGIVFLFQEVS